MYPPSSILIYGHDIRLLETRCWVLENAGFKVFAIADLHQAMECIDSGNPDLFILCHTLSAAECADILENIHSLHPSMKTLTLSTSHSRCEGEKDVALRPFAGPRELITAVSGLVSSA